MDATPSGSPAEADQAVDELGAAVIALIHAWRTISRRVPEHPPGIAATMEMARLLGEDEHRLSRIAELRGVDQSVISRQVTDLQRRGLVCRRPDPTDHRASLIRLTADGLQVLESSRTLRQDWVRGALARRPVADVRTTAELVAALAEELAARGADMPDPLSRPG
ncbi:MarR family winged helix-turn-helix transcriptional regulator [Pseudonocardia sp. GCM10023141]|uniref:MarR family winged helix-turn-helix transcriptional regulator n=1 Tax=Pseudonocardia sp. GCM10023141 TaxID=3252653 RepID=UPI003607D681